MLYFVHYITLRLKLCYRIGDTSDGEKTRDDVGVRIGYSDSVRVAVLRTMRICFTSYSVRLTLLIKTLILCVLVTSTADCARSGDFRSITHHFRTARSVDQTLAVDEYEVQQHQQQQPQSDAAAAELPPRLDSTMRDEMMHMSQKVMDVVDVRIEGMEDMLQHLQTTVHQLGDKVS